MTTLDERIEAAERLARRLLWAFGDSPLAALQEARNAALCEAAEAAKGEGESEFFNPVQAIRALIDTPAPPAEPAGDALDPTDYDAGYLNDYGGGNVEWWHDYLRAEIGRANDHWRDQIAALNQDTTDADA